MYSSVVKIPYCGKEIEFHPLNSFPGKTVENQISQGIVTDTVQQNFEDGEKKWFLSNVSGRLTCNMN